VKSISKTENFGFHRDFENYWDLLVILVQKEIQLRYRHQLLGYIWSVANPLSAAVVYFFAFKVIMKVEIEDYPLFLVAGVFPWQWLMNCIGGAPKIFVGSASLIKKMKFPRNIIPLSMNLNHMVHFLFSVPVIALLLLFFREHIPLSWIYEIPLLTAIQLLLVYGLSLAIGTLNLFFRDLERIVSIITNLLFYITPVLYHEDQIPEGIRYFLYCNPFASIMINWRNVFLHGTIDRTHLLVSIAHAVVFWMLGQWIYKKLSWRFGEIM
jgi:lipopolysaccharide transport system permease protein